MTIPGTKQIPTDGNISAPANCELFSFCIRELTSDSYLQDFITSLNSHLPSYVFSPQTLKVHIDNHARGLTQKTPLERARKLLQKTHPGRASDSGEFGELLLFLFAREVKGAYKLATKIHARGNSSITIPGCDGTFAWRSANNEVHMLVGEAKTTPSSNDGLRTAHQDLSEFWKSDRITHEITLASTHLRSEMTQENAEIYEAYFIDDNPAHAQLKYRNIIFVGYSIGALQNLRSNAISEAEFINHICADIKNSFSNQEKLIEASLHPSIYCFVPFESIDVARTTFAQTNGLVI